MKRWNKRPFELKTLFNPAFCAVILLRAFKEYEKVNGLGMPFSLSFLILPICLHKCTREIILSQPKSYLIKIISENPQILVGFAQRAKNLRLYTMEGLGFAMQKKSFEVTNSGNLKTIKRGISSKIDGSQETIDCQRVARIIGRKFAQVNDRVTIYTTFGVKP